MTSLSLKDYSCFHGYQWIKLVTMVSLHRKRTLCGDDLLRDEEEKWGPRELDENKKQNVPREPQLLYQSRCILQRDVIE